MHWNSQFNVFGVYRKQHQAWEKFFLPNKIHMFRFKWAFVEKNNCNWKLSNNFIQMRYRIFHSWMIKLHNELNIVMYNFAFICKSCFITSRTYATQGKYYNHEKIRVPDFGVLICFEVSSINLCYFYDDVRMYVYEYQSI